MPFPQFDRSKLKILPLADRIVKLHKGKITVESLPDQGTCFTIVFPVAVKNLHQ